MRLATFLASRRRRAPCRRGARRPGRRVRRRHRARPPRPGRPHAAPTGRAFALADVDAARAGAAAARDLRHRPQLRRARGGDRARAARVPDRVHEAAELERAAGRAGRCPAVVQAARLRGRAGGRDGRRRRDRRLRGRRRRQRARPPAPRAAVDAREGLRRRSARGGRGSPPPTRSPTRGAARCARGSTASCARTRAPPTWSSARGRSSTSSPRRARSSPAT